MPLVPSVPLVPASPVAPVAPVGPGVIVRCKARLTPRCRTVRCLSTHENFAQVAGQCTDVAVAAPATPAVPRAMPSTTANTMRLIFMLPPKTSTNRTGRASSDRSGGEPRQAVVARSNIDRYGDSLHHYDGVTTRVTVGRRPDRAPGGFR